MYYQIFVFKVLFLYFICHYLNVCCCCCNENVEDININNEEYIQANIDDEPEFIINFNSLKEEDKKTNYIFLTKPIEWDLWWCWMISIIQSLFSVPSFFEYIANGNFEEPKFKKLKKLKELLLDMIKNQDDKTTNTFSKEKFITYYKYFIDDKIINTGCSPKYIDGKGYYQLVKYGEGAGQYTILNYLNIIKCLYHQHDKLNYDNSNFLFFQSSIQGGCVIRHYEKYNENDDPKNTMTQYYKNVDLKSRLIIKFLGDEIFGKKFNTHLAKIGKDKFTIKDTFKFPGDIIFILDENIKNDFTEHMRFLKRNNNNFDNYAKLVNEIFNKFDFELNAITAIPSLKHIYNINYNNNDKCFYSYNTLNGEEFKKLTTSEVIDIILGNDQYYYMDSIFFITVKTNLRLDISSQTPKRL